MTKIHCLTRLWKRKKERVTILYGFIIDEMKLKRQKNKMK